MNISYLDSYTLIATFLTALDGFVAVLEFREKRERKEKIGRLLGLSAVFAGLVTLSYVVSIRTRHYTVMSLASSVYFAGIDWMLICLIKFVYAFTERASRRRTEVIQKAFFAYAWFDSAVMAVNIFREIAVGYAPSAGGGPYVYQMKPLYVLHLLFTYAMVGLIVYILVHKLRQTPRQYRSQYSCFLLAIAAVVGINAAFLYSQSDRPVTLLDYSVFGYSIGLLIMYWGAFLYRGNDMLRSLSMMIFENIDQGIVLFDHTDRIIMHNRKAERQFPNIRFDPKMTGGELRDLCGVPPDVPEEDQYSVPCETGENSTRTLRCDYRRLRDKKNLVIGNLYVFADTSEDIDLLTGFQRWESFCRFLTENPYNITHPAAVVVFDMIGLGELNRTQGREAGDRKIRALARLMRQTLPSDTFFIRGYEAHLIAVCPKCTEKEILAPAEAIVQQSGNSILFGLSQTSDVRGGERDVLASIETALRALHVKKLLDLKTSHSQTITSLVRALQESDPDTEAHVQRTMKMGTVLGERIGLNDAQLADIRLLCLLHDIGKIGVPLEILNKPGRLTDEEWTVLKTHAEKGYQIAMSSEELRPIAEMILCHHERWDGRGYPRELAGEDIPLLSRMISVVDSYDAMVNDRCYRTGRPPEQAQEEIRRCAGTQFDPFLAEEFLKMLSEDPDIARGTITGGEAVEVFIPAADDHQESGNTFLVPYSRYLLDGNEMIIEVDDRFEAITGYSAEDAVGHLRQSDLLPPEDRAYYEVQVANALSRGTIAYLKHEILRKNGTKIWVVCCGKRYYGSAERAMRSEILIFQSTGGKDD